MGRDLQMMYVIRPGHGGPDLIVAAIVGDGEAETGSLTTSGHSIEFLDSRRDAVVLPILHLNGYKIAIRRCWRGFRMRISRR